MDLRSFHRVTAPGFVGSAAALPLDELRAKRREAQVVEDALSYLRRLVQGRLEIVEAEVARRDSGLPASTLDELVRSLSETLGDHERGSARRAAARVGAPADDALTGDLTEELDTILEAAELGALADIGDVDLTMRLAALSELERTVSSRRRAVMDVLDVLGGELARRYASGEASVDALLR